MSKRFFYFVKRTYGIPVNWMYNLRTSNEEGAFALKPPYLLLANHVNTFDPIIISLKHNRAIHWVAADTLFRNRYLRYLLRRMIGSISKSKSRSDYYTIKQITKSIKHGGVVGMFPEGQRTWDGRSLPIFYATAKLVRMLKVPVVICTLKGGYHTLPRWSNRRRRGTLTIEYQDPIMPEDYAALSTDEIYTMLTERLHYDAYEYQRRHRIIFKSSRRAEYLEHVLYLCPECGKIGTLRSHANDFSCTACGYHVSLDVYGFFTTPKGKKGFETVSDWNSWQQEEMQRRIAEGDWDHGEYFFPGDVVQFFRGYRDSRMKKLGKATANMTLGGIEVRTDEKVFRFTLDAIESLSVAMQRNLEFYHNNSMYRLKFPAPRSSAYKYLAVYESILAVGRNGQTRVSL